MPGWDSLGAPLATHRKPTSLTLTDGLVLSRLAQRKAAAPPSPHDPPRRTRKLPFAGPVGFLAGAAVYGPNQSAHHSQTFPAMSRAP